MKKIFGIVTLILVVIGLVFGREAQIEWTVYLGLILVVMTGAVGVTFITKRFEAIIGGIIISALLPVILPLLAESFKDALRFLH